MSGVVLSVQTVLVAGALTLATSSQGLLTAASKVNGEYEYNFATIPFVGESIKFLISVYLLRSEWQRNPTRVQMTRDWKTFSMYVVPSLIYLVHNNVQFFTLKYVDPATYQIMGNLKIVTTGILLRVILQRKLNILQWTALVLLTCGAAMSQISSECIDGGTTSPFSAPLAGYLFGILSAFLSGFAAVYTEYVMKKNNDSLYWQNAQLYLCGVVFNFAALTASDARSGFADGFWLTDMFRGYNVVTVLVAMNLACSGLLVSWIMKYADSILKVFSTSMAMLVTMLFSVWFFGTSLSLQLILGVIVACSSLQIYYLRVEDIMPASHPAAAVSGGSKA